MKFEGEIRDALVENTIRMIAEGGFEKATTRNITYAIPAPDGVKLNEAYIYRLYGGKEALYDEAFNRLDGELIFVLTNALKHVGEFDDGEDDAEKQIYSIFSAVWRFLLGNEVRCRAYMRFYYSVYFTGAALEAHNNAFSKLVAEFSPLFQEEADVNSIMHYVLVAMLHFANRIFNHDLENNEDNERHIFRVIHNTVMMYLK